MEYSSKINDLKEIIENFRRYQRKALPLCAAENPLSEFCKLPLSGDFQERLQIVGLNGHLCHIRRTV